MNRRLADLYGRMGDMALSNDALERALEIYEERFGPAHPAVAGVLEEAGVRSAILGDKVIFMPIVLVNLCCTTQMGGMKMTLRPWLPQE